MQERTDKAFLDGYVAGYNAAQAEIEPPPPLTIDIKGIAERLGVKEWRAREILIAIRHCYGGGKLASSQSVLMSEFLDWTNTPEKRFIKNIYKEEEGEPA